MSRIKTYSECSIRNIYYSWRYNVISSPQNIFISTHLAHPSFPFFEAALEVIFRSHLLSSSASVPCINAKHLPPMIISPLDMSRKSHGASSNKQGGWKHTAMFLQGCLSLDGTQQQYSLYFFITPHKSTHRRGLPDLLQEREEQ